MIFALVRRRSPRREHRRSHRRRCCTAAAEFLGGAPRGKTRAAQLPRPVHPIGDCGPACSAGAADRGRVRLDHGARLRGRSASCSGRRSTGTGRPRSSRRSSTAGAACSISRRSAFRARMRGKRAVLVLAQGERGFYEAGPACRCSSGLLRYLDMLLVGRIVVVGHARGDYRADRASGRVRECRWRCGPRDGPPTSCHRGFISPPARRAARRDLFAVPSDREVTVHEAPVLEHERDPRSNSLRRRAGTSPFPRPIRAPPGRHRSTSPSCRATAFPRVPESTTNVVPSLVARRCRTARRFRARLTPRCRRGQTSPAR